MNELEIKRNLIDSSDWINLSEASQVKNYLQAKFENLDKVFILHHHYGQADEQYVLMINGKFIVEIETVENNVTDYESYRIREYYKENNKTPKLFRKTITIAELLYKEIK